MADGEKNSPSRSVVTEHAADGEKFSNALREQALLQAAGAKGKIQRRAEHEQDGGLTGRNVDRVEPERDLADVIRQLPADEHGVPDRRHEQRGAVAQSRGTARRYMHVVASSVAPVPTSQSSGSAPALEM